MTRVSRFVAVADRRRRGEFREDEGFTLIELLVVLLIIGILLAIAIPTFLSVTKTAGDTAVQSNLQSGLTNAKTAYLQNGSDTYANLATQWGSMDTGLTYTGADANPSTGPSSVSLFGNASEAVLVVYAASTNHCWGILDYTTTSGAAILGIPAASFPSTVYFNWKSTVAAGADCKASNIDTNPAVMFGSGNASTTGFPAAA